MHIDVLEGYKHGDVSCALFQLSMTNIHQDEIQSVEKKKRTTSDCFCLKRYASNALNESIPKPEKNNEKVDVLVCIYFFEKNNQKDMHGILSTTLGRCVTLSVQRAATMSNEKTQQGNAKHRFIPLPGALLTG